MNDINFHESCIKNTKKKDTYLLIDDNWKKYIKYIFYNINLYYKNKFFYINLDYTPELIFFNDKKKILINEYVENDLDINLKNLWKLYKEIMNDKKGYYSILDYRNNNTFNIHYSNNYLLKRFYELVMPLKIDNIISVNLYNKCIKYLIIYKKYFNNYSSVCLRDMTRENIICNHWKIYLFDFDETEFWDIYFSLADLFIDFNEKEKNLFFSWFGEYDKNKLLFFTLFIEIENKYKSYIKWKSL